MHYRTSKTVYSCGIDSHDSLDSYDLANEREFYSNICSLPLLQVFPSANNATPFGHAHLCFPPGANKQRWLQPPLLIRQGGLSTYEA